MEIKNVLEDNFLSDRDFLLKLDNERDRRIFVKITVLDRNELPIQDIEGRITVGGNISIDIVENGCGKEQVAPQLRAQFPDAEIVFLGDRTMPGGNDHSLAEALRKMDNTQVVQVEGPDDSLNFLKKYCN
jgi:hypothetical protein